MYETETLAQAATFQFSEGDIMEMQGAMETALNQLPDCIPFE